MGFGILGPLHAQIEGREVPLNGLRQAKMLAALLVDANRVVSMQRLIEVMWDGDGPATAVRQIQDAVSGLRRNLTSSGAPTPMISTLRGGYRLDVHPDDLDLLAFERERQQAVQRTEAAAAAAGMRRALDHWRGPALVDVPSRALEVDAARLNALRVTVYKQCLDYELAIGRHHEVAEELTTLLDDHPHDEKLAEQAMLALYRSGRQSRALEIFQRTRRALADDIGIEPAASLQSLQSRILNADPSLAAPISAGPPASSGGGSRGQSGSGPRYQLPADTRLFTGRARELDEVLRVALAAPEGSRAGMVVISAIDGMGGVGKSALAIRAAHRVRPQFPDGQLFVDLRGHTPGMPPLSAADALSWLLRSLGVPPQQIPEDTGERAAFYRDRIADTRTLIVLDNAADTSQVRPLLPGTPGCLVLITSRKRLSGLDDAHLLALDVLPSPEAATLLCEAAGTGRIPAGHPAIAELVTLCGQLPLAIRIVAARLRHDRNLRVEDLVEQLRDEHERLGHLGDEDRNLTAVFESSFTALSEAEQRLFLHLGRIPGPDFDAYAAANLAGVDHRSAERCLESLLDHSLLTQHVPGRYRFHDLIALYARTLGGADAVAAKENELALDRLADYYLHTARKADHYLVRRTRSAPAPAPTLCATEPGLPDRAAAVAWMRTERDNLLALTADAAVRAQPVRIVGLSGAMAAFLLLEGLWTQATALHGAAAAAAHDRGDGHGEADALCDLGRVRHATGDYQAAAELYERAVALFQDLGDRRGEAAGLHELGRIRVLTGDVLAAADLHERALAVFQDLGDSLGEARALCDLGRARHSAGDSPAAVALMERVLNIYQRLGDRRGEANALHDLGYVLHETGNFADAAELHERALGIYQDIGSRQGEANALWNLGRARHEIGDYPAADRLYERALAICQEIGSRQSEADALRGLGRVRHAIADHPAADGLYQRALAIYRDVGSRPGEVCALTDLGELTAQTSGPRAALPLYRQALQIARGIHSPVDEAKALEGSARCSALLGERAAALTDLRRAVALYQRSGAPESGAAAALLSTMEAEVDGAAVGKAPR
jgi:DNA-binding SARP family transcriptional activator